MIYLDNAATTPMHPKVCEAMWHFMAENYGNPSSIYKIGRMNKIAVEESRGQIAKLIGAQADEVFFTSGGTESDNWVLESAVTGHKKGHLIVSAMEHPAVLNKCKNLKERGYDIDYIKIDNNGFISINDLLQKIREDTLLISVMLVNNEIGTIQPVKTVCNIAAEYGIPVHTDAVAAFGHIHINVNDYKVSYISVSGHKINGPKGTGFLYARNGNINPMIFGGGQENGKRSGTENVAGIIGLKTAAVLTYNNIFKRSQKETAIRNYMIKRISNEISDCVLNGDVSKRISGNMNFSFKGINGSELVIMLDRQGICVSSGSACHGNTSGPSHVLKAIGLNDELAEASVRITMNDTINMQEAQYCVECIKKDVKELRNIKNE